MQNIKILIGMLYSGENEYQMSIEALKKQTFKNYSLFEIKNKPNKQAHDLLYEEFMNNRHLYTHFLKLDADMVFYNEHSLEFIVSVFRSNPNLDALMVYVFDYCSNIYIPGQQTLSNNVTWDKQDDEYLFTDTQPKVKGKITKIWDLKEPIILHSPNPSNLQSFLYGVHKGMKILQSNRKNKNIAKSFSMITVLSNVWTNYAFVKQDIRFLYVLAGAEFTYRLEEGVISSIKYNYKHPSISEYFKNNILPMSKDELYKDVRKLWEYPIMNLNRWVAKLT